jgi:hypothetical protein
VVEVEVVEVTPVMAGTFDTRLSMRHIKVVAEIETGTGAGPLATPLTAVMDGTAQYLPNMLPTVVDASGKNSTRSLCNRLRIS